MKLTIIGLFVFGLALGESESASLLPLGTIFMSLVQ